MGAIEASTGSQESPSFNHPRAHARVTDMIDVDASQERSEFVNCKSL